MKYLTPVLLITAPLTAYVLTPEGNYALLSTNLLIALGIQIYLIFKGNTLDK